MIYRTVGLMSGTSLDGLDVVLCTFRNIKGGWRYAINHAATAPFPTHLAGRLHRAHLLTGIQLAQLDRDFGAWCGEIVGDLCREYHFNPLLVASHGHTVFHDPAAGLTLQIGNGGALAYHSGYPVVSDFRSADVAMGGHGAPLVPVGDHYLFPQYRICLNIGGIANVSFTDGQRRVAFDIVPVNMLLNHLAEQIGLRYDPNGDLARSGTLIPLLFAQLNNLGFYQADPPKSLGREWMETQVLPLMDSSDRVEDLLHTWVLHCATQIAEALPAAGEGKMLVTGGGAHNTYLMEVLKTLVRVEVVIPDRLIVDFKEAMVFAFLGLLRWKGIPNVFASVTGSMKDHCAGSVCIP